MGIGVVVEGVSVGVGLRDVVSILAHRAFRLLGGGIPQRRARFPDRVSAKRRRACCRRRGGKRGLLQGCTSRARG